MPTIVRGSTAARPATPRPAGGAPAPSPIYAGGYDPEQFRRMADAQTQPIAPVRAVFNALSTPAYVIGATASGDFEGALRNLYTLGQSGPRVTLSQSPLFRAILPDNLLGTGLGLGIDILTDPLTYVTAGGGGVARSAASRAARQAAQQSALRAAQAGRTLTAAERAAHSLAIALDRASVPASTFHVGIRRPFSRGRVYAVSVQAPAALRRLAERLPRVSEDVRTEMAGLLHSGNGAMPVIRETAQDLDRLARIEERRLTMQTNRLDRELTRMDRRLGQRRGTAATQISHHLDNPAEHPLPVELEPLAAEARRIRDSFTEAEQAAGIRYKMVDNYVSHILARPRDRQVYRRAFGNPTANSVDAPWWVRNRRFKTLDDLIAAGKEHGFKVETNIARILQRRGESSIRAQVKAGLDTAVHGHFGIKPPKREVPDVGAAALRLDEEKARLEWMKEKMDPKPARAELLAQRQAVKDAEAALDAARLTGDPDLVRQAEAAIPEAMREGDAAVEKAALAAAESVPTYHRLMRDVKATGATYGTATVGRAAYAVRPAEEVLRSGAAQRLTKLAEKLKEEMAASVTDWGRKLRDARNELAGELGRPNVGMFDPRQSVRDGFRSISEGEEWARRYVFNTPDQVGRRVRDTTRRSKKTGKVRTSKHLTRPKRIAEHAEDFLDMLRTVVRDGEEALSEVNIDLMYRMGAIAEGGKLSPEAAAFLAREKRIEDVFDQLMALAGRAGADPEAMRRALDDQLKVFSESPEGRIDTRALREENALPAKTPKEARRRASTERGRELMKMYFTPDGVTIRMEAEQLSKAAVRSVERAIRDNERRVAKAEAALERAKKTESKPAIKAARARLREAETRLRKADRAAIETGVKYNANVHQVEAQTLRVQRAKQALKRTEKEAGAVRRLNAEIEARVGMEVSREAYESARKTWMEVGSATRYHDGTLLPPEVADSLHRAYDLITNATKDWEEIGRLRQFVYNVTSRWKALALLSPGYHTRNVFDDAIRSYFFGARNPASYVQAARLLAGRGSIKIRGQVYGAKEFRLLMESEGVVGTGFVRSDVLGSDALENIGKRNRYAVHLPGRGRIASFSLRFGERREDWQRAGLFIEMMKRGEDSGSAARIVRDALFDYGEVGKFVETARRFWAPFITYPSKAIPQTVKLFLGKPGIPANVNKVTTAIENEAGAADFDRGNLPPWLNDSYLVPMAGSMRSLLNIDQDQPVLVDPSRIAGFATLEMLDPRPRMIGKTAGEIINPFFSLGAEAITGYNAFRGRQWRDGERVYAPRIIQWAHDLGIPIQGYGPKRDSYSNRYYPGYSPLLNSILSALPVFGQTSRTIPSGRGESWELDLFKFLTGVPLTPQDEARSAYWARRQR